MCRYLSQKWIWLNNIEYTLSISGAKEIKKNWNTSWFFNSSFVLSFEIFQRTKNKTGINSLSGITLKANMTEENENSHNCNYVNSSLHDFIFTFKRKRIKKKKRGCYKEGIIFDYYNSMI